MTTNSDTGSVTTDARACATAATLPARRSVPPTRYTHPRPPLPPRLRLTTTRPQRQRRQRRTNDDDRRGERVADFAEKYFQNRRTALRRSPQNPATPHAH